MLIIKKDIDFQVLEKYNFHREPFKVAQIDSYIWRFIDYTDGNRKLLIHEDTRVLMILNWGPYNVSDAKLDVIFDLIRDGILEKVPDEEGKFNEDYKEDYKEDYEGE